MGKRRWARIQTRLPLELDDAVRDIAARLGLTIAHCAWHRALDAVDDGETVEDLRDPAVIARILGTER